LDDVGGWHDHHLLVHFFYLLPFRSFGRFGLWVLEPLAFPISLLRGVKPLICAIAKRVNQAFLLAAPAAEIVMAILKPVLVMVAEVGALFGLRSQAMPKLRRSLLQQNHRRP